MKQIVFCVVGLSIFLCGSAHTGNPDPDPDPDPGEEGNPESSRRGERRNATEFEKGVWNVTTNLYRGMKTTEPGNFILSPLSLTTSMVMLNAGAGGETAREIQTLFQLGTNSQFSIRNQTEVLNSLTNQALEKESGVELLTASRIYANKKNAKLLRNYVTAVRPLGEVETLDFTRPKPVVEKINNWVNNKTDGKISEIVEEKDFDKESAAVLVNTWYFKAPWKQQFNKSYTKTADFHVSEDKKVQVEMMYISAEFPQADLPRAEASALFLPYKGDRLSMIIYLPYSGWDLSTLEKRLVNLVPTKIRNTATISKCSLHLPKFNISSSLDLKPVLESLGVVEMFKKEANFTGLSSADRFHVSKIRQKVFMEVGEEGTKAAAVTGTFAVTAVSADSEFKVDRPFIFQIFDHVTGVVLLSGRILNPSGIEPVHTETETGEQRGSGNTTEAPSVNATIAIAIANTTSQPQPDISQISEQLGRIEERLQNLEKKHSFPGTIAAVLYPFPHLQSGDWFPLTFWRGSGCMNLPPDWVHSVYVNQGACVHLYEQPLCNDPHIELKLSNRNLSEAFKNRQKPKSIKDCKP